MEEAKKDFFEETHSLLSDYVDDRILLLKIQTAEKSGKLISAMVRLAVVSLFSFFIILFVSIMGGYFFAELTGSMFYGFSIVAGIYIFLLIIFLTLDKQVFSKRIMNMVIKIFFEKSAGEIELNDGDDE